MRSARSRSIKSASLRLYLTLLFVPDRNWSGAFSTVMTAPGPSDKPPHATRIPVLSSLFAYTQTTPAFASATSAQRKSLRPWGIHLQARQLRSAPGGWDRDRLPRFLATASNAEARIERTTPTRPGPAQPNRVLRVYNIGFAFGASTAKCNTTGSQVSHGVSPPRLENCSVPGVTQYHDPVRLFETTRAQEDVSTGSRPGNASDSQTRKKTEYE